MAVGGSFGVGGKSASFFGSGYEAETIFFVDVFVEISKVVRVVLIQQLYCTDLPFETLLNGSNQELFLLEVISR